MGRKHPSKGQFPKINLKVKMILLISLLIIGVCIIFVVFLERFISDLVEDQISKRAISLAHSVALMPEIKNAFELDDPSSVIQEIVEPIQKESGAEFIVVGNTEGIRYAHPNPSFIGEKMVGGDNTRALQHGESYVSVQEGTLGLSIRGKVPIISDGSIIGVVSVGFLNDNVQLMVKDQSKSLWMTIGIIVLLGISGAVFITHYIKRLLHDMEPEEISHLYFQKEAILQSTHEGIIAVDDIGEITAMNKAAMDIVFTEEANKQNNYIRSPIHAVIPSLDIFKHLKEMDRFNNREMVFGENVVLVNGMPIFSNNLFTGVVFTFRKKTELEKVTEELKRIKQYANAQRALTHEFSNKLHIILGLVQYDRKNDAIQFIKKESNLQQTRLSFLTEKVADPLIQALLQGKYNQANELGITMDIHKDSRMDHQFTSLKQDAILTALGNVIENALESVKVKDEGERRVSIFFTDIGDDCIFEVNDSGSGVAEENIKRIFDQGFSTKKGYSRGTGLALTRLMVNKMGGEIMLEDGELGGACFIIIIPKDGRG
ncbi:ATP-binding protein [Cytobacillus purgationiresistens]|uniref:histidine kinase n=1 Tax=Cytobacillus purgationiresistens TaxID=863449 RepID=A0ABU0AKS2_9BACI|nr:sensor histidine kinase [Cytobacillus purgationiresistens]MDQ0271869.1 two-component system CitB family sensor kinase/CitB family two-component system sensor histidine kinase CitS [Cytobacillus purgationiresistens]